MNIRVLLLLVAMMLAPLAQAVSVSGLYRAEITLPLVSSEERLLNQAFSMAAREVLIKVSGDATAVSGDIFSDAAGLAATWVAQHSIEELSELSEVGDGRLVPTRKVSVAFYEQSINQFLSERLIPVWGSNRPSVLLWLAEDGVEGRQLSGVSQPSTLLSQVAEQGALTGLPLFAPLMDETDQRQISPSEVWGLFEDSIRDASRRYQTDVVAAVRIASVDAQYEGSMVVLFPSGESSQYQLKAESEVAISQQISYRLAKAFSDKYAAVRRLGNEQALLVQVKRISNWADLYQVQNYLDSLGVVRDVYLESLEKDRARFRVKIDGDSQKLVSTIALDRVLSRQEINALDPEANQVEPYLYNGAKQ